MTTIAFDGKSLCTDSQGTLDGFRVADGNKIHTLKDGRICAMCGNVDVMPQVLRWLDGGEKPEIIDDDNFGGIVIDPKTGEAFLFNETLRVWPATIPWAGGTGYVIAQTVFKMGGDARQAIEAACQLDIYSGLPVQEVKIMGCKKGGGKKK